MENRHELGITKNKTIKREKYVYGAVFIGISGD